MATDGKTIGFRADDTTRQRVEEFQDREDYDDRAKALQKLVEVGLRETRSPILFRLKEEVVTWAGWLGVTAIIAVIAGLTTPMLAVTDGLMIAAVVVVVAIALLATVEAFRVLRGESEVGEHLHGVIR